MDTFTGILKGLCLLFENTYFKEYLWMAVSAYSLGGWLETWQRKFRQLYKKFCNR